MAFFFPPFRAIHIFFPAHFSLYKIYALVYILYIYFVQFSYETE